MGSAHINTPIEDLIEYLLRINIPIEAAATIQGLQGVVKSLLYTNQPLTFSAAQIQGLIKASQSLTSQGFKTLTTGVTPTTGFVSRYLIPGLRGFFGPGSVITFLRQKLGEE